MKIPNMYIINCTIPKEFEWSTPNPFSLIFLLLLFCLLIFIRRHKKWRKRDAEVKLTLETHAMRLFIWFFLSGVIWAILFTLFPPVLIPHDVFQENSLYRFIANLFIGVTCWWLFLLVALLFLPGIILFFPLIVLNIVQINVIFLDVIIFCLEPLIALMTSIRVAQILEKMLHSDIQSLKEHVSNK